ISRTIPGRSLDGRRSRGVQMTSWRNVGLRLLYVGLPRAISLGGLLCALAVARAAAAAVPAVSCTGLGTVSIPNVQILSATYHADSGSLPGYCNLVGVIDKRISTQDPD